jgi:hypothetical protein
VSWNLNLFPPWTGSILTHFEQLGELKTSSVKSTKTLNFENIQVDWGYSSVVEHLPNTHEAWGLSFSTTKQKQTPYTHT